MFTCQYGLPPVTGATTGLDINVCPIPVKTDVGQVDLVLRLYDGTQSLEVSKVGALEIK
jgi:hypothetical protein